MASFAQLDITNTVVKIVKIGNISDGYNYSLYDE